MDPVAYARFLGLAAILRNQQGVIRRDQAFAAGLTRARVDDLVRRRKWIPILPRVYVVEVSPTTVRARVRACWLWAGDRSAIGGAAAAWWLGISSTPPSTITVIIPPSTRRDPRPGVRVVRAVVDRSDAEFEDWIRVTTVPRTCLDLARLGEPDLLDAALRLKRADAIRLDRSLERGRGRRGQILARQAVAEVVDNPWSPSERLAHRVLREAGITGWRANPRIRLINSVRHPDIAFDDVRLALEIDGRRYHTDPGAFETDRVRHNEFVAAGWTVLHFTWKQLTAGSGPWSSADRSPQRDRLGFAVKASATATDRLNGAQGLCGSGTRISLQAVHSTGADVTPRPRRVRADCRTSGTLRDNPVICLLRRTGYTPL